MKTALTLLAAVLFLLDTAAQAQAPLVVHEWGTFTSLQDESGQAIGGINTDDEPVPEFVHTLQGDLLLWPTELPPAYFVKGFPRSHPDVTLRLETPVMYFYPPAGRALPMELDVRASFLGGWLTEYYPQAAAKATGLTQKSAEGYETMGGIDGHTVGALNWNRLRVGVDTPGPQTEEQVWLAPRRVRAAAVATPGGESEQYLFYRGVGHVEALLRVRRSAESDWLEIGLQSMPELEGLVVRHAWLADIRQDGTVAFRPLGSLPPDADPEEVLARVPARFAESEYSAPALADLRASMRQGLIGEGLFADEADAMLDTWEAAYFLSAGLRLFFTAPQARTDHYLPLEFSEPVALTRVMVGRIEIVTPDQRALLARIGTTPVQPFPRGKMQELLADPDLYEQVRWHS